MLLFYDVCLSVFQLGDSEVAESYMDAKFGGEGADMVEIVGGW